MWQRCLRGGLAGVALATLAAATVTGGPAGAAGATVVTVGRGDTLSAIAARFHIPVATLAAANGLTDPDHIEAGAHLVIPGAAGDPTGGGSLVVAPGDTLWGIAQHLGLSVQELATLNGLADPNRLLAGSRLSLPGGAMQLVAAALPAPSTGPVVPTSQATRLPARLLADPTRLALRPLFVQWAAAEDVPASLLEAMCWWESGWQAGIVSPTGAYGIGQLEPSTVAFVRTTLLRAPSLDPRSVSDNIAMTAAYLHWLLVQSGQRPDVALAGYYQGLHSVQQVGILPATRQYVSGILAWAPAFAG